MTQNKPSLWLFLSLGIILALTVLLLTPATSEMIFGLLGFAGSPSEAVSYNGFDAFIPFIPGYFPENFEITFANNGSQSTPENSTYTETYASETHFFKTIQSQGPTTPEIIPDAALTIQGQPASLGQTFEFAQLMGEDLDLNQFDTQQVWLVRVVLKGIRIQLVSNLPEEEAIRVTEGLIPSICTSTPTPQGIEN